MRAAGHHLYLATAKPHVYARRITAYFGLDSHLSDQFGPELDGTRNDKGALLAFALQKLQLRAADCVMVGDRHHDLDAARLVGMKFVGVDWGYGQEDELGAADMLCRDVAELSAIVAQMASFDG